MPVLLVCLGSNLLQAQDGIVEGSVFEKTEKTSSSIPLPGANVYWLENMSGTTADVNGYYRLQVPTVLPAKLVIRFVGYQSDTLLITKPGRYNSYLEPSVELGEVTIEGKQDALMISTIKPINVEQIGQKELLKAACCNLSESFETNPSVNIAYTDAITGAKEIQLLGLSGIYAQMMTENIPNMRGLASTYGLGYIPGPWMESIQVTKGSGSVANGFESTTGQINVEYIKPEKSDRFYINGYGASSGNTELNIHGMLKAGEKTSTILFMHGENMQTKLDHQHDGFLDMPLVQQMNLFNRWSVTDGKRFEGRFGVKAIVEDRKSGQEQYNWGDHADTTSGYGVRIKTHRYEAFSKTGLVFPETPWKSAGLILSASLHDQESYFGLKTYDGRQTGFYGSLIYMSIIGNTNHKWKAGADFRYDDFNEFYIANDYSRIESVPGAFFEYTLDLKEKFGLVAGIRADYHNQWDWFYTPRLHMKYNFTPEIIVRASAGKSFRTANVLSDNSSVIMATSRELVIEEKLNPEKAWNFGANFTARFKAWYRPGSFTADYYYTMFDNQVIIDTYNSSSQISVYNLNGESYARSFQVAFNYEAFKFFDVRLAYKNDDVRQDYSGISGRKPLVPEHRALLNTAYHSRKDKWRFDFTLQYHGESRVSLANESSHHHDDQVAGTTSPDYFTMNGQVTRVLKSWDIYLGGENLTNYTQDVTIIGANDPFGPEFDATNIWGPVMGIKIYAGFRYVLKQKKTNPKE